MWWKRNPCCIAPKCRLLQEPGPLLRLYILSNSLGPFVNNIHVFLSVLEAGNPRWRRLRFSLWWEPATWFAHGHLLVVSSQGGEQRRSKLPAQFPSKDTNPIKGSTVVIIFWGISIMFSILIVSIYISINSVQGFFLHLILTNIYYLFLILDVLTGVKYISLWSSFAFG